MDRILSVLKGKCPRCETGEVFRDTGDIFRLKAPVMNDDCPHCHHHFELAPGYFLGAMYVSYALAIVEGVVVYVLARPFTASSVHILAIIIVVVLLLSLTNFMYSRLIWMYLFTRKEESLG